MRSTRRVQLALAALWAIDALLQLQAPNFTPDLVYGTILGNIENQPQPIAGSILTAVHLLGPHAVELNVAIIVVQLALCVGLVWRRTVKLALAGSIAWALGIWWFGEGFGGIFAGEGSILAGAPGAALLYALLALLAWPVDRPQAGSVAGAPGLTHEQHLDDPVDRPQTAGSVAGAGALGERRALYAWALLWVGGALLPLLPLGFAPVYALQADLQTGLNEEPGWMLHLGDSLSRFAGTAGIALPIAIAILEAGIGVGVLCCERHRRAFLAAAIVVSCAYWLVGQQLAGLLTGGATDVDSAPLYVLFALTLWPRRAGARSAARTARAEDAQTTRATTTTATSRVALSTSRGKTLGV